MSEGNLDLSQPDDRALATYRYLRLIAVVPAIWLLVSIFVVWAAQHELRESISDYYAGPLRDVFVGSLMACGICLITYKGESKVEDYVLNFAGVNLFFVALVPNSFAKEYAAAKSAEGTLHPPVVSSHQLLQTLGIGIATFLAVAAIFVIIDRALFPWSPFKWREHGKLARRCVVVSWFFEGALLIVVGYLLVMVLNDGHQTWAFKTVHFGAATLMVINLVFAASSHAFPDKLRSESERSGPMQESRALKKYFRWVAIFMSAGLIAALIAYCLDVPYTVIAIEMYEIALFIAYWIAATRQQWAGTLGIPGKIWDGVSARAKALQNSSP